MICLLNNILLVNNILHEKIYVLFLTSGSFSMQRLHAHILADMAQSKNVNCISYGDTIWNKTDPFYTFLKLGLLTYSFHLTNNFFN